METNTPCSTAHLADKYITDIMLVGGIPFMVVGSREQVLADLYGSYKHQPWAVTFQVLREIDGQIDYVPVSVAIAHILYVGVDRKVPKPTPLPPVVGKALGLGKNGIAEGDVITLGGPDK